MYNCSVFSMLINLWIVKLSVYKLFRNMEMKLKLGVTWIWVRVEEFYLEMLKVPVIVLSVERLVDEPSTTTNLARKEDWGEPQLYCSLGGVELGRL